MNNDKPFKISRKFLKKEINRLTSVLEDTKFGIYSAPLSESYFLALKTVNEMCFDEELLDIEQSYENSNEIFLELQNKIVSMLIQNIDQNSKEYKDYYALFVEADNKQRALNKIYYNLRNRLC